MHACFTQSTLKAKTKGFGASIQKRGGVRCLKTHGWGGGTHLASTHVIAVENREDGWEKNIGRRGVHGGKRRAGSRERGAPGAVLFQAAFRCPARPQNNTERCFPRFCFLPASGYRCRVVDAMFASCWRGKRRTSKFPKRSRLCPVVRGTLYVKLG